MSESIHPRFVDKFFYTDCKNIARCAREHAGGYDAHFGTKNIQ